MATKPSQELAACLRCGSEELAPLTLSDGLWAEGGESFKWVCRDCDWQGAPLLFDDRKALEAFRRGLAEGAGEDA